MGTRSDLQATAATFASAAKEAAGPAASVAGLTHAAEMIDAAKTALEAAKLASDTSESEVDKALAGMLDVLAEAGVDDLAMELPTAEFLREAFQAMLSWRQRCSELEAYAEAYDGLRERVENLESDFRHAGTETSTRIAGRMRMALDDATVTINNGRRINGSSGDAGDGE